MITPQQLDAVSGSTAVGSDGRLGTTKAVVPLADAAVSDGEDLRVPYAQGAVTKAPHIDSSITRRS
jgi:hypothetical protein